MTQSLSLYEIEHELLELLRMRDQATEEGAPPAEIEAIDQALSDYFTREVRKVNHIAEAIHSYEAAAAQALSEAKRMKERAESLDNTAKRIKAATLRAMQDHRVRVLETAEHRLRVQANGGKEPLEIEDETLVPQAFQGVNVRMSVRLWRSLSRDMTEVDCREVLDTAYFPDTEGLRSFLKQAIPCPECKGSRKRIVDQLDAEPEIQDCPRCKGDGTVPATIPGARLLPRGYHLRAE